MYEIICYQIRQTVDLINSYRLTFSLCSQLTLPTVASAQEIELRNWGSSPSLERYAIPSRLLSTALHCLRIRRPLLA
jgi:hypothetical protein